MSIRTQWPSWQSMLSNCTKNVVLKYEAVWALSEVDCVSQWRRQKVYSRCREIINSIQIHIHVSSSTRVRNRRFETNTSPSKFVLFILESHVADCSDICLNSRIGGLPIRVSNMMSMPIILSGVRCGFGIDPHLARCGRFWANFVCFVISQLPLLRKHYLPMEYPVPIWLVSLHLSCGGTCHIWTLFNGCK